MTPATNNLSRARLQQLIAAAGKTPSDDNVETTQHHWDRPNCFSKHQVKKLESFARALATMIQRQFTNFFHCQFEVQPGKPILHFAETYIDQALVDEQQFYYLGFIDKSEQTPCGLFGISEESALLWTMMLLGTEQSDDEAQGKQMSQLEQTLLSDVAVTVIDGLAKCQQVFNFAPEEYLLHGQLPVEPDETTAVCKIEFSIKRRTSDQAQSAYLLITCDKLEAILGKCREKRDFSSSEITAAMITHLNSMPVTVTAELSSMVMGLDEIMNLQQDDILLLDKRVDETIDVLVEGEKLFTAQPARSAGKYAVLINERCK